MTTTSSSNSKTNVCLICGIHTTLSLNIFEPRSGPNIVDVIFLKYKFRAERDENEDKYICYSCNNWLINWHSLQNKSESQNYESIPSSSRSENRYKRTKNAAIYEIYEADSSSDKENFTEFNNLDYKGADDEYLKFEDGEQDQHISSSTIDFKCLTVKNTNKISTHFLPKKKFKCCQKKISKREYHREHITYKPHSVYHNENNLVKKQPILDANLVQMLRKQGTIISKEISPSSSSSSLCCRINSENSHSSKQDKPKIYHNNDSEIVLSFNTAISEVMKMQIFDQQSQNNILKASNSIFTCKLPKSLTVSLVTSPAVYDVTNSH